MTETLSVRERVSPGSFLTARDETFARRVTAPAFLSVPEDDWTFKHASDFWRLAALEPGSPVPPRLFGEALDRHLDAFAGRLALCAAALECYAGDQGLASGLRQARLVHRMLLGRYRRHLTLFRLRRKDDEN